MNQKRTRARYFSLLLCLAFVFSLCLTLTGCGGANDAQPERQASETEVTSSEAVVDPNAVVSTASILSTGDIMLHSPFLTAYYDEKSDTYDFHEIFQYVKRYTEKADYAVTNLEISLGGFEPYTGYPCFNSPDAIIDALVDAGFDMALTAGNHVGDTGFDGFERTQKVLTDKGLDWIGTVEKPSDKRYKIVDINGIKVGMVNYVYITHEGDTTYLNGVPISDEFAQRINTFDYNRLDEFYRSMEQCMADMKADGAEATILYIHWGEEYHLSPVAYQEKIAQKMCDIGFDAIVGGHPHVIEPVEVITSEKTGKKTVCLYSMGNELSNQRHELMAEDISTAHTEDGLLFYTNFSKKGDGTVELTSVDVIPTWVHMYYNENDRRTYEIVPLKTGEDWSDLNLSATDTGKEEAQASYDRTMELVGKGIKAFNALGGQVTTLTDPNASLYSDSTDGFQSDVLSESAPDEETKEASSAENDTASSSYGNDTGSHSTATVITVSKAA
ncbi:MAG: CapA family protein [Oscillospiraceae bacterium]|nr:CapA family protein [Oscillospiraceae bacterium]